MLHFQYNLLFETNCLCVIKLPTFISIWPWVPAVEVQQNIDRIPWNVSQIEGLFAYASVTFQFDLPVAYLMVSQYTCRLTCHILIFLSACPALYLDIQVNCWNRPICTAHHGTLPQFFASNLGDVGSVVAMLGRPIATVELPIRRNLQYKGKPLTETPATILTSLSLFYLINVVWLSLLFVSPSNDTFVQLSVNYRVRTTVSLICHIWTNLSTTVSYGLLIFYPSTVPFGLPSPSAVPFGLSWDRATTACDRNWG